MNAFVEISIEIEPEYGERRDENAVAAKPLRPCWIVRVQPRRNQLGNSAQCLRRRLPPLLDTSSKLPSVAKAHRHFRANTAGGPYAAREKFV